MAKIVLSIAALLMLASAYFSFASKGKITELIKTKTDTLSFGNVESFILETKLLDE